MNKQKTKIISVRVYGIFDKKKRKVTKVSLNQEEIQFEIDLDNLDGNLFLCIFDIKMPL